MRFQTSTVIVIASALLGLSAVLKQTSELLDPPGAGQAAPPAEHQDEYVFAMFHEGDVAMLTPWQTLVAALAKRPGQARAVNICVNNPAMKTLVDRYGLGRTPLPIVLAIAPNGAVTGAFGVELTDQEIDGAFVSPAQAACMKQEQTRQLVSLSVASSTAHWPMTSTWFWLTARPPTSNPAIASRCCSCFKSSSTLTYNLDFAVVDLLSANITATK